MERLFQILAVILGGIAAYFLWQENGDGAFVAAVFGAVSFFLSVRFQVKERLNVREAARLEEENRMEDENFYSQNALNDVSANEQISEQRTNSDEQRTNL